MGLLRAEGEALGIRSSFQIGPLALPSLLGGRPAPRAAQGGATEEADTLPRVVRRASVLNPRENIFDFILFCARPAAPAPGGLAHGRRPADR